MRESCETCVFCSMDSPGSGSPYEPSWHICCLHDYDHELSKTRERWFRFYRDISSRKLFPFHPAPGCYRIGFHYSKYADMVDILYGRFTWQEACDAAHGAFNAAMERGEWILPTTY